jgi:hypothetical protein
LSRELSRIYNGAEDSVEIAQSQPVLASMLATDAIEIGSDAVDIGSDAVDIGSDAVEREQ